MSVQLLPPLIEKERIPKEKYASLPPQVAPYAKGYAVVHRVVITPQKTPTSKGVCRTHILAPASFGTPGLVPINLGRVGPEPATDKDEMRPALYYMLGTGSFKFRTNLHNNTNHYTEVTVNFQ